MKKEITICDGCQSENEPMAELSLPVGDTPDAVNVMYDSVDLCIDCAEQLLEQLTSRYSFSECRELIESIRGEGK